MNTYTILKIFAKLKTIHYRPQGGKLLRISSTPWQSSTALPHEMAAIKISNLVSGTYGAAGDFFQINYRKHTFPYDFCTQINVILR